MIGKIKIVNKEYQYRFNINTFDLTIFELSGIFIEKENNVVDLIKSKEILNAYSFDSKFPYVRFIVKWIKTLSLDSIVIKILYYVKTEKEIDSFDAMAFASDELNYFYDIENSFEKKELSNNGLIKIKTKNFDKTNKEYFLDEYDLKSISFNFSLQLNTGQSDVLKISTEMVLKFIKSQNFNQIYDHYYLIYNFFQFVTYRRNIAFNSIKLKSIRQDGKYNNVGELGVFIDKNNFYIEEENIQRNKQIKLYYLGKKVPLIIKLIKSNSLYMNHYPDKSTDKISPARFLLVTAAFEWEFQEIYGDFKYNENRQFREVTELIKNFVEEEKNKTKGKKKKYLKTYQKSFIYNGVSLSEKIQHALKDNKSILSIFIENFYKLNNVEEVEYSYPKISDRIGIQRNNYAHGQIDRDMNYLVILDFIVLEWLIYSMRLKDLGFEKNIIKKILDELFQRNLL